MAQIEFIVLESYGSGLPVELNLHTKRFLRREAPDTESVTDALGEVSTNYQKPIGRQYRYQRGISVALKNARSGEEIDGWKWVDERPTAGRRYLEFRRDAALYKVLYRVLAGAHNEREQVCEDYDAPVARETVTNPCRSDLTCDDGYVVEYPQPGAEGLQALLCSFAVSEPFLRRRHGEFLNGRVVPLLMQGANVHVYGATSRAGGDAHNDEVSRQLAREVFYYLRESIADSYAVGQMTGPDLRGGLQWGGESIAIRDSEPDHRENEFWGAVYLEVYSPLPAQFPPTAQVQFPGRFHIRIGAHLDDNADNIGHAFVSVDWMLRPRWSTFGYWPRDGWGWLDIVDGDLVSGMPGVVADDSEYLRKLRTRVKTFEITEAQARAAQAVIRRYVIERPEYRIPGSHCGTFAVEVLAAAGHRIIGYDESPAPVNLYRLLDEVPADVLPIVEERGRSNTMIAPRRDLRNEHP